MNILALVKDNSFFYCLYLCKISFGLDKFNKLIFFEMNNLIIYAHPKTKGFCPYILSELTKELEAKKVKYEVLDLYKMKYDPILLEKELYTAGADHKNISKVNLKIQSQIKKAKNLFFIFPVWWNSVPAILKGFFDKVLTSPFAYSFSKRGMPVGHIKGKRAYLFVTFGGPAIASKFLSGDRAVKVVTKDTLGFCGIKCCVNNVYSARNLDEKRKEEIKKKRVNGQFYVGDLKKEVQ